MIDLIRRLEDYILKLKDRFKWKAKNYFKAYGSKNVIRISTHTR
jgi:hypothetical protein